MHWTWRGVGAAAAALAGVLQMAVGDKEAVAFGAALLVAGLLVAWKGWLLARLAVVAR